MSVDPNRRHNKKQSWWKKNNRTRNKTRNRTFQNNNTIDNNNNNSTNPQNTQTNQQTQPQQQQQYQTVDNNNNNDLSDPKRIQQTSTSSYMSSPNLLSADPSTLTVRQMRTLQDELCRVIKLNQELEMELNLRASQVEQMEDNLRLVADQSKMIGIRAMEQEQKLLEIKKALELKTKQLVLYRGSKADQLPLNEITILPMHLRGKFSEFLRGVLISQKKFFESALHNFIMTGINDKELKYKNGNLTRINLLSEINKIGNSLAYDYMSELELRLNGTFSSNMNAKYTLNDDNNNNDNKHQQQMSISVEMTKSNTPQPVPQQQQHNSNPNLNMMQRPISPGYNQAMHFNNNTLSQSVGPPLNHMNGHHTPNISTSIGSAGGLTPQTSVNAQDSPLNNGYGNIVHDNTNNNKSKKVKPGGAFKKAKQLLSSKKNKKKKQKQQQQQLAAQQQQQQQLVAQQQQQQQIAQQQYQQQLQMQQMQSQTQLQHHQYPSMNNPNSNNMNGGPLISAAYAKAQQAYSLNTVQIRPVNKSNSNIATTELHMQQMMNDLVRASSSRSNTVNIKDTDDEDDDVDDDVKDIDDDNKSDLSTDDDMNDNNNNNNDDDDDDDDDDDEDDDKFEGDAALMAKQLESLTKQHTKAIIDKHGVTGGNNELNRMWSQFVQFKKEMDRPSDAPLAFTVPDKVNPYVELRDMLECLPFELSYAILQEQQMNSDDRIKDVLLQRGCWPTVRFLKNNRITTINKVIPFDIILKRLELYLQSEKDKENGNQSKSLLSQIHLDMMNGTDNANMSSNQSKTQNRKQKQPGLLLLGSLDPQKTTGFRLHQITAIVRHRNEARDSITAINLRVGRLWNMDNSSPAVNPMISPLNTLNNKFSNIDISNNLISDSIDFFQSLESPSTMLLLGPNTSEKCALCREITKELSSTQNIRTALVDTRSTVGGFTKSPIETGSAVRFYVNSITNQFNQIDATRSIYPQVVVLDEVLSSDDIESISKLQSEGISVIVGTNIHSLEALLGHHIYSQLLPPQDRLVRNHNHNPQQYSSMSPHLLILEINDDGTEVKMFKNIPAAVKAIKRFSQPEYKLYKLRWKGYNSQDTQNPKKFINNPLHKRTTSRMVNKLMKDTFNVYKPVTSAPSAPSPINTMNMNLNTPIITTNKRISQSTHL